MSTLLIRTKDKQLSWAGQTVSYAPKLEGLLLALAYRHRETPLSPADLERCAVRCGLQRSSLRTELYGFLGCCAQVWSEGPVQTVQAGRERHYRLSPRVTEVSCDLDEASLAHRLDGGPPASSTALMLAIRQAEHLFEQGNYSGAAQVLTRAEWQGAHPEQEVTARCLLNWVNLRLSEDGRSVRRQTRALHDWFQKFDTPERGLSDLVRARVLIQCARTPAAYQQRREARRLYLQAAKLLPEYAWRERSSVEAGLGYAEARGAGGSLSAAEQHYRQALHYATLACWPWSVQVQQGNLADVLCGRYRRLPERPRQHPLLSEASALLLDSQALCDQFGFRGSGDTELYRARIAIWQGRLAEAWALIRAAFDNLDRFEGNYDYPFGWEIRGEWYLAAGEKLKGLNNLRHAALLEEQLGTGVDAGRLRRRIAELEGRPGSGAR